MNGRVKDVAAAFATAALWAACFEPIGLPWLSFAALIPWIARDAARPKDAARADLLGFVVAQYGLHVYALWWATTCAPPLAWLVPILGIPFSIATILLLRFALNSGLPRWAAYAGALVFSDLLRDAALQGLTWISLGYALDFWTAALQLASVGRAHLLTAIVAVANVLVFEAWSKRRVAGASKRAVLALVALLVATHVAGEILRPRNFEPGPKTAGLQPNVPQHAKQRDHAAILRTHLDLLKSVDRSSLDLLVYAETSFPAIRTPEWDLARVLAYEASFDPATGRPIRFRDGVLSEPGQVTLLGLAEQAPSSTTGIPDGDEDGFSEWNVAVVVPAGASDGPRYRKRGLAPFGEYLPISKGHPAWEWTASRARAALGHVPDLTQGDGPTFFKVRSAGGERSGAITICFEAVFPKYFREAARGGADFVVNMSNDAWFPESSEQALVDQATRFRAVESGRSVFRVSNTGISSCFAPDGSTVAVVEDAKGRRTEVAGLLAATVPISSRETFFVEFGDAPWLWVGASWFGFALFLRRKTRRTRA